MSYNELELMLHQFRGGISLRYIFSARRQSSLSYDVMLHEELFSRIMKCRYVSFKLYRNLKLILIPLPLFPPPHMFLLFGHGQ